MRQAKGLTRWRCRIVSMSAPGYPLCACAQHAHPPGTTPRGRATARNSSRRTS